MSAPIDVSLPSAVFEALKQKFGGINPILKDVRENHLIDASFDGSSLVLRGDDEEIIDIVVEYYRWKADMAPVSNITLGENGTIKWKLKDSSYKQPVFDAEFKMISENTYIKIDKEECDITVSCKYPEYKSMKSLLKYLDNEIKTCHEKEVELESRYVQLAKSFQQHIDKNKWCCVFSDKQGAKLKFYGRDENDCKVGVQKWEGFKEQGQMQSASKPRALLVEGTSENVKQIISQPTEQTKQVPASTPITMESNWGGMKQVPSNSVSTQLDSSIKKTAFNETMTNKSMSMSKSELESTKLSSQSSSMSQISTASSGSNEDIKPISKAKKTPGKTIGSGDGAKYTFQIGTITFFVYKQSVTEIKGMNAITNAANERLMHGGGVAYYISKAAGKKMDQNCDKYISKNGLLQVTDNYVSIPGDMKCDGIIHAVGPSWYNYKEKEADCARDLYKTIKNILKTANYKKFQKVALSAISSGLFGVPKRLCAEMYIKAFADFAYETNDTTVKEIHFIDVSREILDLVIDAHKVWLVDDTKLDFRNALQYVSAGSKNRTKSGTNIQSEDESFVQTIGTSKTSYGETVYKYRVCNKLEVHVYKGSLIRLETVDAIAVFFSPDSKSLGDLERSVRSLAGHQYCKEVDKNRNGKNGTVFVSKLTGSLKCKSIVHIISYPVRRVDDKALSVYETALTYNCRDKIRSLGMPLFGTGAIREEADIGALCYNVLKQILNVCIDDRKPLQIQELHLVNLDSEITLHLKEAFERISNGGKENKNNSSLSDSPKRSSEHAKHTCESQSWIQTKTSKGKENDSFTLDKISGGKCQYCNKSASTKVKKCGHIFCDACSILMKSKKICLKCSKNDSEKRDECPVCLEPLKKVIKLPCSHKLCQSCYEGVKAQKPQCPICQDIFGEVTGNQPDGDMFFRYISLKSLPGYEGCGTIEIAYIIPPGNQSSDHPRPGMPFKGIERRAYLPNNDEGRVILHLLRRAFDQRLIFTIGESRTTGKENVVTWNDIHHKTRPTGGPEKFGYPDPTYLNRVREELAAKGID